MKKFSRIKGIILCCIITLSVCSCMTPKRIDKYIGQEYGNTAANKRKQSDYITVNYPKGSTEITSLTYKRKVKILPLLLYWKYEYGTNSTLSSNIPAWYFHSALLPYANAKGLRQKLNGNKLELTIKKMPTSLSVVYKGWMVFILFYNIHYEHVIIDPEMEDMVVAYRVMDGTTEVKNGTISLKDYNRRVNPRIYRSFKKTFWEYLDTYNENCQKLSKDLVDQLIKELN